MNAPSYSRSRKIDPSKRSGLKPDGTPADNDRVEIGPTQLAFDEWAEAGLEIPNLKRLREHRLKRIVDALGARGAAVRLRMTHTCLVARGAREGTALVETLACEGDDREPLLAAL